MFAGFRNHLIVGLFQTHQRRYCHFFSRGGMVEDDLGEIKDFNVGHQSLEEIDPDLSLSAMFL